LLLLLGGDRDLAAWSFWAVHGLLGRLAVVERLGDFGQFDFDFIDAVV